MKKINRPVEKRFVKFDVALILFACVFIVSVVGCIDTHTQPVDYGVSADPNAILDALNKPTANLKAADIQVGEFVAMETTQDLALGESFNIVGDTGATVTARSEDTDKVVFNGVIKQLTLQADGTYAKVSREGEVLCASKTACSCGECTSTTSKAQALIGVKTEPITPAIERQTLVAQTLSPATKTASMVQNLSYTEPAKLLVQASAATVDQPTYHRFSMWQTSESPPANVASLPGCLGIANCRINLYHVNFDEVYWDSPAGTKVHVEATLSPDVPYLSRNLSTCQSLLVKVGTDGSNILLKQCSKVFDFRFKVD